MALNLLRITFADQSTVDVQTTLEDRLAFETTLRKNRSWGKLEDNTMKLLPFLAWNAARRNGKTELDWEQFTTGETAAISVDPVEDEEDDELEVDGLGKDTQTEPSTSSPWSTHETTAARHGNGEANQGHA